jgi:predicted esterase
MIPQPPKGLTMRAAAYAVFALIVSSSLASVFAQTTRPAADRKIVTTRPAGATSAAASQPAASTPGEKAAQFIRLQRDLTALLEKKDYAAAAAVCGKMIELAPRNGEAHYNLACCLARLGKSAQSLDELARAVDNGFNDADHIRQDDDLESLHNQPRFKQLVDKLVSGVKAERDKIYDKGVAVPGVRTEEGDPAAGLRWRLRMSPTASASQPDRLILWLHPSGGSMNDTVEALAPELNKRGYALLVPTAKNWAGWSMLDGQKFVKETLADVARVKGIDARRPILFGYSAGGQLAMLLWLQSPEKYSGLVLDAAYPMVNDPSGTGRVLRISPPKNPAVKDCPLFVLLGDQDAGSRVWIVSEDAYRQAGVPLTIYFVRDQGHTWLFGGAQRDKLYRWLAEVAAGRKPGVATSAPDTAATQPTTPRKPLRIEDIY